MKALTAAVIVLALSGCSADPGLAGSKVDAWRDSWGIPHIFAPSVEEAFRAEGYLEAEDRLWQMETFRRAAKGELAEVLGESAFRGDVDRRRNGYTEGELREMFDSSSERMRSIVTAYVAGVNAFLAEGKLPPQFAERKIAPRAWTEADCMAIGVMMARRFGEAGGWEQVIQSVQSEIAKRVGREKATMILRDLLPDHDPYAATTLNDHERAPATAPKEEKEEYFVPPDREWLAILRREAEIRSELDALGIPAYAGSNAWVVAPKKSADGRPILYGGPMMGFKMPSICNEMHLAAPGLNVAGMSFPGVPGIMIGFNEKVAWTTTSGGADLVDVYVLDLNPDNREEYRYRGKWIPFERIEVEIKVAGQEPRRETIRRSRYGPVVERKENRAYTRAFSFWKKEQGSFEGVLDLNFASSVEDVRRAMPKIATSHNFFAADADGHIGFWYCGAHPVRKKGHDPRLPQKGDGSMDWEGILPFERWPQAVDPPHGFFGNWNNKPAKDWEPSQFGKVFWGKKIVDTLEKTEKLTFEQMERLARDAAYYDYQADYFMPYILEAARGVKDDEIARAAGLLAKYDFVKREGRPEPVIVERWSQAILQKVFGDELRLLLLEREVRRYLANALLYLFEKNGMVRYDFLGGRDLKTLAAEALGEAVKGGIDKLAWKDHQVDFGGKVGKVKSAKERGTFQMTVELGKDGPRAETVAAPGQSEAEDSPHATDQLKLFEEWKYKPFVFRRDDLK